MSLLRIAETQAGLYNMTSSIFDLRNVTLNPVTFTTTTQSAAFQSDTSVIRCISDVDCHIAYGTNPTATTDDLFLRANVEYDFYVAPGNKIAVVEAA